MTLLQGIFATSVAPASVCLPKMYRSLTRVASRLPVRVFSTLEKTRLDATLLAAKAARSDQTQKENVQHSLSSAIDRYRKTPSAPSTPHYAAVFTARAVLYLEDKDSPCALATIQEGISLARHQLDNEPSSHSLRRILAEALLISSRIKAHLDRAGESLSESLEAASLLDALPQPSVNPSSDPLCTDPRSHSALRAASLVNAAFRHIELEQPHQSINNFLAALAIHNSFQPAHFKNPADDYNTRGVIMVELSRLYASIGQGDQAIDYMSQAVDIASTPSNPHAVPTLFSALTELAELYHAQGKHDLVADIGQRLLTTLDDPTVFSAESLAEQVNESAAFFLNASHSPTAHRLVSALLTGLDLPLEEQARSLFIQAASLLDMHQNFPKAKLQDPLPIIRHSLALYQSLGSPPSQTASVLSELSRVLFVSGQLEESCTVVKEAIDLQRLVATGDDPTECVKLAQLLNELAQRYLSLKAFDVVPATVEEAGAICKRYLDLPSAHTQLAEATFSRVKAFAGLERWEDVVRNVDELQLILQSQIEDESDMPESFAMLFQSTELLIIALEALGYKDDLQSAQALLRSQGEIIRAMEAQPRSLVDGP